MESRKVGLNVMYRLGGDDVLALLECLRGVAQHRLAEVERLINTYLTVKDSLEPVPARELLERAREDLVTVLDVRPAEEYAAGHLPGAINIPLAELEVRLGSLDSHKEVIAYCRGPHCVLAFDAVARLRAQGRRARRLEGGFPEWRHAGLPIETAGES